MNRIKSSKYLRVFQVMVLLILYVALVSGVFYIGFVRAERKENEARVVELVKQKSDQFIHELDNHYRQLEAVSYFLSGQKEITEPGMLEALNELCCLDNAFFRRIWVADSKGNGHSVQGDSALVDEEAFFQKSIAGDIHFAYEDTSKTFVVSVPVFSDDGSVRGVLFAECRHDLRSVYAGSELENKIQDLLVIDRSGAYVGGTLPAERVKGNVFDYISKLDTNITVNRLKSRLSLGTTVDLKVKQGEKNRIYYFYPRTDRNWYIVTSLPAEIPGQSVHDYDSRFSVLFAELVAMILVVGIFVLDRKKKNDATLASLNRQLKVNEETYRITAQHSAVCIFTYDASKDQVFFLNEKYRELDFDQPLLSLPMLIKTLEEREKGITENINHLIEAVKEHKVDAMQEISLRLRGSVYFFRIYLKNIYNEDNHLERSVGTIEDITEMKVNRLQLKKEEAFRKSLLADCLGYLEVNVTKDRVLKSTPNIIWDQNQTPSYTRLLEAWMSKRMEPKDWDGLNEKMSCESILKLYQANIRETTCEYLCLGCDGAGYWASCEIHISESAENNDVIAYLVYRNIDEKKRMQMKLETQAQYDLLTSVYNRPAGTMHIRRILENGAKEGTVHAFLMADMDNFKQVNDTLGHIWGDKVLIDVARLMKEHVRQGDVVCRLGGDEFVVFLQNVPRTALERIVEALLKKLNLTYENDGVNVTVTASIGITLAPEHGDSFEVLYSKADKALYKVKKERKNGYYIWNEEEI